MNLLDATQFMVLFCCCFNLKISFVSSEDLSRDDLKFLFGDKHPTRASYINIRIKNNRKKRETAEEVVTIDEDGMHKKNPIEENQPDGQMVSEFKPIKEEETVQKENYTDIETTYNEIDNNFLSSSDLKVLRVKMKKPEGGEPSSVEGVVSEPDEENMQSLFQDFLISTEKVQKLEQGKPEEKYQKDDIEITIEDETNSMDFLLHPNKQLFSDDFKVIVRDTVYKTDGDEEEEVQYTEEDTQTNCVYVGESETNPDIQVALTNCNGEGFTGLIIAGEKTHLIRPVHSNSNPKKRNRRDTEEETTDDGLHIIHETTGSEKCGVLNAAAMRAPKNIVELDEDLKPHTATKREAAIIPNEEVVKSLRDKTVNDVKANGPTVVQLSAEERRKISSTLTETDNVNTFGHSWYRPKRQTESYTIETAVFVDDVMYDVVNKFKGPKEDTIKKVESIVFAIMNGVSRMYKQSSMETNMEIKLKQLQIVKSSSAGPSKANGEIKRYLEKFCKWQTKLNAKADSSWDHALMLSGLNLYSRTKSNDDVIGLAWVAGMCNSDYSCTINEGTSFEAVYVIAHEVGHSLGMYHDGSRDDDNFCSSDSYIMSASTGPGKVTWSSCSNLELDEFLDDNKNNCMERESRSAKEIDLTSSGKLPGETFTVDMQCSYALGETYKPYTTDKKPYDDICREIWCHNVTHASRTHPALDGTKCGTQKNFMCSTGRCVAKADIDKPLPNKAPGPGRTRAPTTTTTTPKPKKDRNFTIHDLIKRIRDMFGSGQRYSAVSSKEARPVTFSFPDSSDDKNVNLMVSHDWVLKDISDCSAPCGGGYLTAKVTCVTHWTYKNDDAIGNLLQNDESVMKLTGKSQDDQKYIRFDQFKPLAGKSRIKRDADVEMIDFGPSSGKPTPANKPFSGRSDDVNDDAEKISPKKEENEEMAVEDFMKFINSTKDQWMSDNSKYGNVDNDEMLCDMKKKPASKFTCNISPCKEGI